MQFSLKSRNWYNIDVHRMALTIISQSVEINIQLLTLHYSVLAGCASACEFYALAKY